MYFHWHLKHFSVAEWVKVLLMFKSRLIKLEKKNQRQSLLRPWEMGRLPVRQTDAAFPPDIWRRELWCWWWEMFLACSGWMRNHCYLRQRLCCVCTPPSHWDCKKKWTGRENALGNCIRMCNEGKYPFSIPSKSAIVLIAQLLCFLSSAHKLVPLKGFEQWC